MSDAAFKTAKYPSYTTAQLTGFIAEGHAAAAVMADEIERRKAVAAGDMSRATDGERLRAGRALAEAAQRREIAQMRGQR